MNVMTEEIVDSSYSSSSKLAQKIANSESHIYKLLEPAPWPK